LTEHAVDEDNDLISLADSYEGAPSLDPISPTNLGSVGKGMDSSKRSNAVQRDSFSDLAKLMKAKKPYIPVTPPTPRLSLSTASNGETEALIRAGDSILTISGMNLPIRNVNEHSILSPIAKPFVGPGSVSAFLQEQETAISVPDVPRILEYRQKDFDRLEALTNDIVNYPIGTEADREPQTPSPSLLESFHPPPRIGPVAPPTPVESVQAHISAYDRASEPVVRVTKGVWKSMGDELSLLMKQKRQLEGKLAGLERDNQAHLEEDHDVNTQLGKLRYQNEVNRDQKAAMGRLLAQKDVEIRQQELDIDNLRKRIVELEAEVQQCGKVIGESEQLRITTKANDAAHARDLEFQAGTVRDLQDMIERLTLDRDAALRAQAHARDHETRAQNLADTLSKREKYFTDLRQKYLEEQMRVTDLEDEVERLLEKVNQENLDEIQQKLQEKSSQCDRFRTQLKATEQQWKLSQSRLKTALNGGEALRGGAHLVAPHENGKLPKAVMPCSECYAKNIPCDNAARCRNCTENNHKCARWRCSLKQKLGECHMTPCMLPHDVQGWLIMKDSRPQW
jgi:hypothetical protein